MITVRRTHERGHTKHRKHEAWLTFYPEEPAATFADGFGVLVILNESSVAPNQGIPLHARRDAEVVTYVLEGAISYEDSKGSSGVVHAGEFRRMTAGHRIRYRERNALATDWVHVFQVGLRQSEARPKPSSEQKRFTLAERQGILCTIASRDGRSASLHVHEDAVIYSAVLDPGQHVVHELLRGRRAWVHIVRGEVILGDLVLTTGDGAGVTVERSVALTARRESEILLVDLAAPASSAALAPSQRTRRVTSDPGSTHGERRPEKKRTPRTRTSIAEAAT